MSLVSNKSRFLDKVHSQHSRVLHKVGAYGRTATARLFRKRSGPSPVGSPPHAHTSGKSGLKDVRFRVDMPRLTVVVGHEDYNRPASKTRNGRRRTLRARKPVPQLLNEGGRAQLSVDSNRGRSSYVLNYRPRPFRKQAMMAAVDFMGNLLATEGL